MNSQLVDSIIEAEWAMFAKVANVGGPATCQMNPRAFRAVRGGQLDTWTDAIGQSYLQTRGKNESAVHWDMITDMTKGGEIWADGERIYLDGRFLI